MNKYLLLALIGMIGTINVTSSSTENCTPWLGICRTTDECCRDLVCLTYAAKCVPGKIVDDNRPIGDGPFPPQP